MFKASDFLEEDRPWVASDFKDDEEVTPDKLAEAESSLEELGRVLEQRRRDEGAQLKSYDPGFFSQLRRSTAGRKLLGDTAEEREARVAGGNVGLLEIPQAMLKMTTAPPQLTEPIREATEPLISRLSPEAAGVTRAVRDVAIGALGSLPAGALMPARMLVAPFAADYASTLPEQFQAIKEAEDTGAALQALATTGLGGLLTTAGTAHALSSRRPITVEPQDAPIVLQPERTVDARKIIEAEKVDGPLREVPAEVPQEVPAQVDSLRVSPPTGQAAQGEVLLAPDAPVPARRAVLPEARELADKYASSPAELETLAADAVKAAAEAKVEYQSKTGAAKMEAFERWEKLAQRPQPYNEALQLLEDRGLRKAPDTAATAPGAGVIPAEDVVTLFRAEGEPYSAEKFASLPEHTKAAAGQHFTSSIKEAENYKNTVGAKSISSLRLPREVAEQFKTAGNEYIVPPDVQKAHGGKVLPNPTKTAVFNGIQMAGPSFRYLNEKTGRWNDVSAETAKQRGIEIPAEELAKAEAASKPQAKAEPALGAQLAAGIPDPVATAKAAGELIKEGVTMARRVEFINNAISKPKEAGPPIKTEVDTPLPDFNEHGASKKIFSQPFGFERLPVLGALFGGTRRLAGHVNESLTTYWAERQIGKSISSAFGNEYSWLNKPFEIKDGQITNITPAKEGASRYISDVFESLQKDPASYKLNAEQQKAFDAIQKLEKDFSRLEDRYKIGKSTDNEVGDVAEMFEDVDVPKQKGPYFPRIVTSRPGGATTGLTRGSGVGSKAFFEKPRLFETEAEGWARGYQYEPSIVNRLATRADRLYKRIADKRLAGDASLGGIGRKEVEAQLKASFAEELVSGEMTEKKIAQMADSIEARGRVYEPAFFGKIFPEETAAQLNKAFPKSQSGLRQAAVSLNNAMKGLQLGLDLGVGFIQGQALLARHPGIWGKAQFNSLTAMFHKEQFPNYVRNNLEPIRELAQLGSGVGRLEEYMAGLGEKELLSRIPGVQAVTAPFARQFQTFLDVAKVEMWKAYRETTPREQWSDVAQTIESILSSGRMEGAGVSQSRSLIERVFLLAPAYYRGGLNNIAAMAEKGVSGQVTRRAMVAYATAGGVLFYGLGKMLGMSDDELKQRMNPARSDFMMWRVKTKDRISNVGFGGFYRSLLRLMGNTAKTSMDNPGNWKSLSPEKNPITKWYRGHAGPVVTGIWDGFSGKDYMGEDTDIVSILRRSVTPITVQSARGKPGQPTPGAAEAGGSFIGLQSFPSTSKTELNKLHSEWLSSNEDPKVKADYDRNKGKPREQSQYAALITALIDKDEKAVAQSIKDLQAEGVKRSDIFKRMNPYTADGSGQKPLFHESAALEGKFRKSQTPEQMKLYEEARKDRKEQWTLFLKAWRDSK